MTLVLNRIDDRLIHGQVVVGWGQPLDVEVHRARRRRGGGERLGAGALSHGRAAGDGVRFHSAADAAPLLDRYRTETRPGILLTGDIATMRSLVEHGGVRDVNVGGIHHRAGRRQHLRYVFLTPEEEEALRELASARRRRHRAGRPRRAAGSARGAASPRGRSA